MYSRVRCGPHTRCGVNSHTVHTRKHWNYEIISDDVQSVENIQWSGVARISGVLHGILVHGSSAL